MIKQEINITYSELRVFSEKVMDFIRNNAGVEDISLSSKMEEDLGMTGDDVGFFLEEFISKFSIDLIGFEFESHFNSEGFSLIELPLALPIILLRLPIFILIIILPVFGLKTISDRLDHLSWRWFALLLGRHKKDLMVGDLIVFVVSGKFLKREEAHFCLI